MREARVKPARSKTEPANEARAAQKRPRLFFAKVSETLAKRRNFVIKELSRDFEILEPVPPPFENPAHDSAVEERIRQADLAIHLLNEFPGESIPGEATGYIQRQAEIARAARTAQFIWTPKSLVLGDESEPEDPDERAYRAFLGDVKARNRGDTNDFVQGMESEIVHEIRNSLDRRKAPTQPSPAAHPTVLLDFHAKDEDYFYDVYQFLDEHGIQPKLNRAADSGSNSLRFEKQLEQVSALIVFFGQVARDWVLERVLAAARITAIRRYPVKAFGIYLAPPRKTEGGLPDDWKPLTVYPLDNTGGFDPASFAPLLAQLGGAGTTKSHA